MDESDLRERWAGRYFNAALAFMITQGLLLLIWIVMGFAQGFAQGFGVGRGMTVYTLGVVGTFVGVYLIVTTALLARRRWGAILATLWAVGIITLNVVYIAIGDPIGNATGDEAIAAAVGSACGGVLNLLALIFVVRALLAKRPPEDPPVLSQERGDVLHPYGQLALKPQRMGWQVKLLLVIGIALAGGGALAVAVGFFMQWKAAVVDEGAWQRYEFPESGFAIEFPAAPETTEDFIESHSITFSRLHRVLLRSVQLDAVHYRGPAGMNLTPDELAAEATRTLGTRSKVVHAEFHGYPAVYAEGEGQGSDQRKVVLAVQRGEDTYIIVGVATMEANYQTIEYFRNSFEFLP